MSSRQLTYIPDSARRVVIAANPKSGPRSGRPIVDQLAQLLSERDFDVVVSTDIQQTARHAAEAMEQGQLRAVVAAGGDGTAGLVANYTEVGVPIAVLPLGTENLLAKYLGVKANAAAVRDMLETGATVPLDMGRVGEKLFLLMVSCGFDADVVRRLHADRDGHIHHLSYAKPILDSIRNYEYPELRVYCDDQEPVSARWCFVFNLPCYSMGLPIAPGASGTDGLLDVSTFKEGSLLSGLMYLSGVLLGQHESWRDYVRQHARKIRIEADQEVPFEIDGDPGGTLPVEIEVIPERLTLMVPQAWAEAQGFQVAEATQ